MAAFDFISKGGFALEKQTTKRDSNFSLENASTDLGYSSSSARLSEEEDVDSDTVFASDPSDKPVRRSSTWSVVENCLDHLESVKETARTWPRAKPVRCVSFGKAERRKYLTPPQASVCHNIAQDRMFVMCQDGVEDESHETVDAGRSMTTESSDTMYEKCKVARSATWNGFVCDERCGETPVQHMRTGDDTGDKLDMSVIQDSNLDRPASRLANKENINIVGEGPPPQPMYSSPMFVMPVPGGMMPVAWNATGAAAWNLVHVPHQASPMYMTSSAPFGWGFPQPGAGPAVPPSAAPPASWTAQMQGVGQPTTVMLRNIPNNYDRDSVVELLDSEGFSGHFDFLYLPLDFKSRVAIGYAFVNFASHAVAVHALRTLNGFSAWKGKSRKVCEVTWSETHQGLEANIDHVRNSPVNRRRVPEEFKPIIIKNGKRMKLPPPSKRS